MKRKDTKEIALAKRRIRDNLHYQLNKHRIQERRKKFWAKYPWRRFLYWIRNRCNNPNNYSYGSYGGKGIKCLLSMEDLENLWFRDKAYELNHPSIDRKNNKGHYEFDNCQFIEHVINSGIHRKRTSKKANNAIPN